MAAGSARATLLHALFAGSMPALALIGLWLGGPWLFLPVLWFSLIAALLDAAVPEDRRFAVPDGGLGHRGLVWFVFPPLLALLLYGLHRVSAGGLLWWEVVGVVLALGLVNGGIGLTAAHELIHRRAAWERGLGVALSSLVLWALFRIEHVHGHHRTVGTPDDPTTAKLGESLYAYLPRSILGSIREAWAIEAERLAKQGKPLFGAGNRMLHYAAIHLASVLAVWVLFGPFALLVFVAQALVAVQLLQSTGYIEHYGLTRQPNGRGGWTRMGPRHSWNSAHRLTNWMTFNLGLHAEHHTWPAKPFPELVDDGDAMRMPLGYPGMVLLAMLPPLWFRVMDPKVRAAGAGVNGPLPD